MKNDIITDVFYFRLNRKTQQKKYSVVNLIFTVISILVVLPIVYSLPNNEIELPKDVSNDFKNGIVKANNNIVANGFVHSNNSYYDNTNNGDDGFKHLHRRKGGKHHHKKFNLKKHSKFDHKGNSDDNIKTNDLTNNYKYMDKNANKFDYYPIEPVNIKYDPKDDEKIRFVLITGDDNDNKEKNSNIENIKTHKRNKRDVSIPTDENSQRIKRNPLPRIFSSDLYNQLISIDPWNNQYNRNNLAQVKVPIRGKYHNVVTPHKAGEDMDDDLSSRLFEMYDNAPIWDRRPVGNSISSNNDVRTTTASPRTIRPPVNDFQTVNRPTPAPVNRGPSNCIWAIVNCCSKSDLTIRYGCFEDIGCTGAFWDFNPCGDAWQLKAIEEAEKFFEEEI